jgi:hypothetical protein
MRETILTNAKRANQSVAQIFNLPYRRFTIGSALNPPALSKNFSPGGIQFRDTAEFNSALRSSNK